MFLRLVPAEPPSSSRLGGATELLGQPQRRSSAAARSDAREMGMRVHPTRPIRQYPEVRGAERPGSGGEGDSPLPIPSAPVGQANGRGSVRSDLPLDERRPASNGRGILGDRRSRDENELVGQTQVLGERDPQLAPIR